jgi:hypothetical protein
MTRRTLTVRETIHHGDYRNVREQTIPATWDGFVSLLLASPYNGGHNAGWYAKNEYAAELFAGLIERRRGEFGWAHYEVVGR